MPGLLNPPSVPPYVPAPPTKADLDYANLPIIDLSLLSTGSRDAFDSLANQTRDAMANHGFLYVINHGYTTAQTKRIFDIANIPFTQVSEEDKRGTYMAKMKETGSYQGYKLRQYWHIDGGVRDQLEHYNFNKDVTKKLHPEPLRPFLPEIAEFSRHNHEEVMHPILRLLAAGMELPEDTFVKMHGFENVGESFVRFMKYYPRSEEEETKSKNVWLKGHTDFNTISILYSQPVAALQILTKDGKWKWVRHIENALVINVGDAIELLSGGFYRATVHRVVQPPPDQRSYTRLGAFYFGMADDNVLLAPLLESPVLQRVGIWSRKVDNSKPLTMEESRKSRIATYGQTEAKPVLNEKGMKVTEEEIINGFLVRHYH